MQKVYFLRLMPVYAGNNVSGVYLVQVPLFRPKAKSISWDSPFNGFCNGLQEVFDLRLLLYGFCNGLQEVFDLHLLLYGFATV